ncbi:hypothetical protein J2T13_004116 [Paenibacillus sp. DS2015]|uniref:DUF4179 domain-containing protein n=1 Tax=Paenibacillus sp. DS2015 TaxID=3373917 RepID=UPI003D207EF9
MKCLSIDEMEEYIMDAGLSTNKQIVDHISTCFRCLSLYHKQLKEEVRLSQELFEDVLPNAFTTQVMASIKREEMEMGTSNELISSTIRQGNDQIECSPEQIDGHSIVPATVAETTSVHVIETPPVHVIGIASVTENVSIPRKGLLKRRGRGFWKLTTGVALLVVIMCSVIMYSVPTLAEKLRSLFAQGNVDIGLFQAQEYGLVEHPNIKVKDKGYTLKIDEAVADPSRVIIALQLFGPDGKHERKRLKLGQENDIIIKDDQGNMVGSMYDMGYTNDFYYMVAFFPEPLQTDRITIEGHITQLGKEMRNIPFIQGEWNFDFSIDMKEANKRTTVTPLEGSYITPNGMTVRLKRLTRMVQGVRLEIETELNEEALIRSSGELWKKQGLKFHFEDMEGSEIHSVNTRKVPHKDSLMTESHLPGDKPGLMHWSYTFKYLPLDDPYNLVFDGYFVSENDDASIEFEPSKLKGHPVPFYFEGDEMMLQDFTVESPPNTNGTEAEGTLHVNGKLWNEMEYDYDQWKLKVLNGQEYNVSMEGSSTTEASGWKDGYIILGGGSVDGLFEFRAPGMTTIPDRLQLIRTVVNKLYTNVDWTVPMNEEGGRP